MNPLRLSGHFDSDEFRCRHCGQLPWDGISRELIEKLERLRELVGGPLHVASGYRCPAHNAAMGGVPHSQHLKGTAADIVARTCGPVKVARLAERCEFGGIGRYAGFVHVDVGPAGRRWRG